MKFDGENFVFQSPQWGSNSKDRQIRQPPLLVEFQSPQWGSNSKVGALFMLSQQKSFQSPQWGSNSKVDPWAY